MPVNFIVEGEGVRDNKWSVADSPPLRFEGDGRAQEIIEIPPTGQAALAPTVRVLAPDARPVFRVRLSASSSIPAPPPPSSVPPAPLPSNSAAPVAAAAAAAAAASAALPSSPSPSPSPSPSLSVATPAATAAPSTAPSSSTPYPSRPLVLRGRGLIARPSAQAQAARAAGVTPSNLAPAKSGAATSAADAQRDFQLQRIVERRSQSRRAPSTLLPPLPKKPTQSPKPTAVQSQSDRARSIIEKPPAVSTSASKSPSEAEGALRVPQPERKSPALLPKQVVPTPRDSAVVSSKPPVKQEKSLAVHHPSPQLSASSKDLRSSANTRPAPANRSEPPVRVQEKSLQRRGSSPPTAKPESQARGKPNSPSEPSAVLRRERVSRPAVSAVQKESKRSHIEEDEITPVIPPPKVQKARQTSKNNTTMNQERRTGDSSAEQIRRGMILVYKAACLVMQTEEENEQINPDIVKEALGVVTPVSTNRGSQPPAGQMDKSGSEVKPLTSNIRLTVLPKSDASGKPAKAQNKGGPREPSHVVGPVRKEKPDVAAEVRASKQPLRKIERRDSQTALKVEDVTYSRIKGIHFIVLQWKLEIDRGDASVTKMIDGSKDFVIMCMALENKGAKAVTIPDSDVTRHVKDLQDISAVILFLQREAGLASESEPATINSRSQKQALTVIDRLLYWIQSVTASAYTLCEKYTSNETNSQEARGYREFLKGLTHTSKEDTILKVLRQLKKNLLPDTGKDKRNLPQNSTKDDGRPYFTQRSRLWDEVSAIMRKWSKMGLWTSSGEAGPAAANVVPSEQITSVRKVSTTNKQTPAATDATAAKQTTTAKPADAVNLPSVPIPRRAPPKELLPLAPRSPRSKAPSPAKPPQAKPSSKPQTFDHALSVKRMLIRSNTSSGEASHRNDERRQGPRKRSRQEAGSSERGPQRSQDIMDLDADDDKARPAKKKKKVSFASKIVSGSSEPTINGDDLPCLFYDGYDILGCGNSIQEPAVLERANQLSRGAVFGLFAFLRLEVAGWKSMAEGQTPQLPEFVDIPYPQSALKQVGRLISKNENPRR